ncbi:MAG TPA: hypothetical protein VM531_12020 [Sphingomicrobium sp.]|jgi:predicted HAD superfamily Cof-like phosphohydrolase|nr:hypothetical protein [Sphingomicrobium sp.]
MDIIGRIFKFNREIIGIEPRDVGPIKGNEQAWLAGVLREEALEFDTSSDVVEQADALVDSIVYAIGGFYRLGLKEEQVVACLNVVLDANFKKKAGQKSGRVYEGVVDAVKPEGWVGPEDRIKEILTNA